MRYVPAGMGPPLAPAACSTGTVWVIPPPTTVMFPERADPELAITVAVRLPFEEPLAGETVSHEVLSELAVQATFDVTVIMLAEAVLARVKLVGATDREFVPGCVTLTVALWPPGAVSVSTPLRGAAPLFAVALIFTAPSFVPLEGEYVSQLWLLDTVQDSFAVTVTVSLPAAAAGKL